MRRRHGMALAASLAALLLLGGAGGVVLWQRLLRAEAQILPDDRTRFAYGSLGGDLVAGIPYPIFMVLPRVFPDLVARYATEGYGPDKAAFGGYGAFGLAWEPGERLPVGLSIRRLGYERVTVTCALCHTATYRLSPDEPPRVVVGGPAHTANIQALLRFLFACANDRRFSATRLLPEMALHVPMDALDWVLYATVLIPGMRTALHVAQAQLGWMDDRTAWGPGRDDAFNLPKFVLTQSAWDHSVGNTDFPALWDMATRDGMKLHAGGEADSLFAVSATSAIGTGALPVGAFRATNEFLAGYVRRLPVPAFPGPIDAAASARGKAVFDAACAACHAVGGARTGQVIPLAEIGTDPEHVRSWTATDAARMNRLTAALGLSDAALHPASGYVARPLSGVWLLAPYLHNGSVPTLADLLRPPSDRPAVFYRGYDVLDREAVGFVASGAAAAAAGFRHDTRLRGNSAAGHAYGTGLPADARAALLEYLKTL